MPHLVNACQKEQVESDKSIRWNYPANIQSNIEEDSEIKCNKWWVGTTDIKLDYVVILGCFHFHCIAAFE